MKRIKRCDFCSYAECDNCNSTELTRKQRNLVISIEMNGIEELAEWLDKKGITDISINQLVSAYKEEIGYIEED